jgi:DNA polymerase-3 subunit gamma/tau
MVFYRKYRPQTIGELDSVKLRETLHAILQSSSVAQAFLFTGPKGLGKTSTARIVAKVVNCLSLKKGEPCNACEQCIAITRGVNIDVLEIDGASNRGIDEVRDLRERIKLAPNAAKKKIYIIDEVHMLTTEAFNALLKTIEEPPSHVMFIFCTTEPQKVPATIMSRCFHISFSLATEDEIVHSLERIVIGESLSIEKEVLHLIARLADGGFRDAAKILEEVSLLSSKKPISKAIFENLYGIANVSTETKNLLAYLQKKDAKKSLVLITKIIEQGMDIKFFIQQLLLELHTMLLTNIETTEQETNITIEEIKNIAQLFSQAYQQTKYAVIPQLPLELAIVEYISSSNKNEEKQIENISGRETINSLSKKNQALRVKNLLTQTENKKSIQQITVHKQHDLHTTSDELTSIMDNLIYKVKPYNHSVAGILRGCKIKSITNENVVFETAYKFHKERLEDRKTCEIIEKAAKELTGKIVRISVELRK